MRGVVVIATLMTVFTRCVLGVVLVLLAAGTVACTRGSSEPRTRAEAPPTTRPTSSVPVRPVSVPLALEGQRLVLDVEISGAVLHVLVDTGSSGLRVAASKVPPGAAVPLGPAKPNAYVSGLRLGGVAARASVRIGDVASPTPVPVELVTSSDCLPAHPDCGAANGHVPAMMGGRFDGIIGLSANSSEDVPNPLWYVGAVGHSFAVHLDPAGGSALVLGAPAEGFALQPLTQRAPSTAGGTGPPVWEPHYDLCAASAALPGGRLCAPGGLDTGNPSLADLHTPDGPDRSVPAGTPITVSTADGHWSADYVAGPGRPVSVSTARSAGGGRVGLGLPALMGSDLRTDLEVGTIGLRR